jgi:hypothetical protein
MADRKREITRLIKIASRKYGVAPHVLQGLIDVESGGNPTAKSGAGAQGLTQFMPGTAKSHGVQYGTSHHAVATQVLGAAKYLDELGYKKDRRRALASYNAGPGNPGAAGDYPEKVLKAAGRYYKKGYYKGSGGGAKGKPAKGGGKPQYRTGLKTEKTPGVDNSALRAQVKLDYLSKRGKPGALLEMASSLKDAADVPSETRITGTTREKIPGTGGGGRGKKVRKAQKSGKLIMDPGADRPGAPTSHYLKRELKRFSGAAGMPIEVGTGSNHSRMTTSGNVSDHWTGHGADIKVGGDARSSGAVKKKGDMIAGRTLMSLGVSRKKARQMAQKGGLYNVNYKGHRYQVIWKTDQGGNHYNHVHVGVR